MVRQWFGSTNENDGPTWESHSRHGMETVEKQFDEYVDRSQHSPRAHWGDEQRQRTPSPLPSPVELEFGGPPPQPSPSPKSLPAPSPPASPTKYPDLVPMALTYRGVIKIVMVAYPVTVDVLRSAALAAFPGRSGTRELIGLQDGNVVIPLPILSQKPYILSPEDLQRKSYGTVFEGDSAITNIPGSKVSRNEPWSWELVRASGTETLCTALLVFAGTGAAVSTSAWLGGDPPDSGQLLSIALSFGFALAALVWASSHISGGHLNPAVTFAFLLLERISFRRAYCYLLAQLFGAAIGSAFLRAATDGHHGNLGVNGINVEAQTEISHAFFIESVCTFFLVYVILETTVNKRSSAKNHAPLAIGFTCFIAHIVAIPYTGCGINPARSFGPALVTRIFTDHWIYWMAPAFGSAFAALMWRYFFNRNGEADVEVQHGEIVETDDMKVSWWRVMSAEFFGTALYVYAGCGAIESTSTLANQSDAAMVATVALAFGLSWTALVYACGHTSGGHLNPIVTLSCVLLRVTPWVDGIRYFVSQLIGGIVGAAFLRASTDGHHGSLGVTQLNSGAQVELGHAFVIEAILSFMLIWVVLETRINARAAPNCHPLASGLVITVANLVAFPYTKCGINPARSFGPAVVTNMWQDHWIYWVSPTAGAIFACALWHLVFRKGSAGSKFGQSKK